MNEIIDMAKALWEHISVSERILFSLFLAGFIWLVIQIFKEAREEK